MLKALNDSTMDSTPRQSSWSPATCVRSTKGYISTSLVCMTSFIHYSVQKKSGVWWKHIVLSLSPTLISNSDSRVKLPLFLDVIESRKAVYFWCLLASCGVCSLQDRHEKFRKSCVSDFQEYRLEQQQQRLVTRQTEGAATIYCFLQTITPSGV